MGINLRFYLQSVIVGPVEALGAAVWEEKFVVYGIFFDPYGSLHRKDQHARTGATTDMVKKCLKVGVRHRHQGKRRKSTRRGLRGATTLVNRSHERSWKLRIDKHCALFPNHMCDMY